jgi:hypothetical protein
LRGSPLEPQLSAKVPLLIPRFPNNNEVLPLKHKIIHTPERLHKDIIKEIREVIVEVLEKALAGKHDG